MRTVLRDLLCSEPTHPTDPSPLNVKWATLLFGSRFSTNGAHARRSRRHFLKYIRTSCTCLRCIVEQISARGDTSMPTPFHSLHSSQQFVPSSLLLSSSEQIAYTPNTSALANFVRPCAIPSNHLLRRISCGETDALLQIGTILRLHSRAAAKLSFTDEMKSIFSHLSYSGPLTHEMMYREVTTIGVDYYQFNKGLRSRHVYIKGKQISLPIEMGVVKLGTRPLHLDELGSRYILYRRQTMQIYTGQLVLQGNVPDS